MNHLPPNGDSALFRARYPRTWWQTQDHHLLIAVEHAVEMLMFQMRRGKGGKPKPIELPVELPKSAKRTPKQVEAARRRQSEHLKRRRAQRNAADIREVGRGQ